jgi:hypothetical protein
VGRKAIIEASCWEKQATCHKPDCFQRRNGKKTSQSNNKLRGTWRGGVCQVVHTATQEFFPPLQVEWTLGSKVLVTSSKASPQKPQTKRRVWRVKIKKMKSCYISNSRRISCPRSYSSTEGHDHHQEDNRLMPTKEAQFQLLPTIF